MKDVLVGLGRIPHKTIFFVCYSRDPTLGKFQHVFIGSQTADQGF